MSKQALAEGKCVVIGLQSTGEARTVDVIAERGEELDDFVSGPKVPCRPYRAPMCGHFWRSCACPACCPPVTCLLPLNVTDTRAVARGGRAQAWLTCCPADWTKVEQFHDDQAQNASTVRQA